MLTIERAVLGRNAERAAENRREFRRRGVLVLNVVSAPGSGKTELIERTLRDLGDRLRAAVIVGDLATDRDARRLARSGALTVQLTTGSICHLEAGMIAHAFAELAPTPLDLLVIENVGNLVCPAAYDLGEDLRIVVMSVTEGEDKPLKYPVIFKTAQAVVISKIDLADVVGFHREEAWANIRGIAPQAQVFELSARTGSGLEAWYHFLLTHVHRTGAGRAARRLVVRGRVQGVGFRPYVCRLAMSLGLAGGVRNVAEGVVIEVEGPGALLSEFQNRLTTEAPAGAVMDEVSVTPVEPTGRVGFEIVPSGPPAAPAVRVPPDRATCPACRAEVFAADNRRRHYPFTSCIECGPRYTIIERLPYDRSATSMRGFTLCPPCATEYHSPADRRFHAEPNACPACGPRLALWDSAGRVLAGTDEAVKAAAALLRAGRIVALKGLGGFQLLVRADDAAAVGRLRQRKQRPGKPFAVMVSSLAEAEELACLTDTERRWLTSPENPIVLVTARPGDRLAPNVAPGLRSVGLFLPTTPLHHLLLAEVGVPVIATSGNRGGEPIVIDEHAAIRDLAGIADAFLVHDRPIVRRADDSVLRLMAGEPMVFRLARGFAPWPLPFLERRATQAGAPPCLATGGHQKVALAAWTGHQAVLAPHLGDMDDVATRVAFQGAVRDWGLLYHFEAATIVCDLHPDYFTTRWAHTQGRPVVAVQHHHAHAAACVTEHGLFGRPVLAFTWDGTGYGPDGTVWGGEVLARSAEGWLRRASLRPFPLPGGEAAIRHPNRTAFGLLYECLGEDGLRQHTELLDALGLSQQEAHLLAAMIRRRLQTPATTSVGRLFDGIAALLLGIREVSYEGEAAIALEAVAAPDAPEWYRVSAGDWRPMLRAMLEDWKAGRDVGAMAGAFHAALAGWAKAESETLPGWDVVLGGGCFQNRLLLERTVALLRDAGRSVYWPRMIPPGDGGLAAGQLATCLLQPTSPR
ncbi:MAG: carbamoyltransferase HypF [Gemmataceae bacterium]|nr:carbamoyltransferase HypF [Gemmataceae bacterium]MDW8267488.1 carbamoyltransferase HypF [Gemmataceae bacterium]